ncbi:hypothetical protein [Sphingomonas sp.]|uniref:hypothetical protein n=1 Tax=Sphingomonas sp. TaxID=28214 RepID=UPI002DD6978B|nr:hypothetical protein [Sphingomonas sp.]
MIGELATIALAEAFGGTRLYIPMRQHPDCEIVHAIGIIAAQELSHRFAPDVIRVPLLRNMRAQHYRDTGLSHAKIAVRLGMTEAGVNRLFARLKLQNK